MVIFCAMTIIYLKIKLVNRKLIQIINNSLTFYLKRFQETLDVLEQSKTYYYYKNKNKFNSNKNNLIVFINI